MTTAQIIVYIVAPVAGYLLGSIPFGLLIGFAKGVDIRKTGSGNIGATNLGRTLGMKFFWYAFALDALKGFLPVFVMSLLLPRLGEAIPSWTPLIAGAAAMIGHIFPVWLKFKGGKGVATAFGLVVGLWPLYTAAGILGGLTFIVIFLACRYISVSSMLAAAAFTFYVYLLGTQTEFFKLPANDLYPLLYIAGGFTLLIVIKHRTNIGRLMKGTEPKFGQKKKPPESA